MLRKVLFTSQKNPYKHGAFHALAKYAQINNLLLYGVPKKQLNLNHIHHHVLLSNGEHCESKYVDRRMHHAKTVYYSRIISLFYCKFLFIWMELLPSLFD